jgi:hypothetical protein
MATPVFFRVKAVEGFHVVDAVNLHVTHRVVGHTKTKTGETRVFGKQDPVPVYSYTADSDADLVAETRDGHIRSCIMGGALDYVETVLGIGKDAKVSRDHVLVAATTENMLRRARAAAALAKSSAEIDASNTARMADADAGRKKAESQIAAMSSITLASPDPAPAPAATPAAEAAVEPAHPDATLAHTPAHDATTEG